MRLIRTDAEPLVLEEFLDNMIPPYAILSHTWGEDEVTLLEMKNGEATSKAGYAKIKYASDQAAEDKYDYVWVDTCCIDKTSSAELSEAINSMYKWYQKAEICYAFLTDVHVDDTISLSQLGSSFSKSRWFTRGWTLQELIAPSKIVFYGSSWIAIGTNHSLNHVLSDVTGIDYRVLDGRQSLREVSVAIRMSWASKRQTTRQEDIAYSLMGLFNVNMPLLYGEGKRSFTRLLEEIIRDSDDQSIFAWKRSTFHTTKTQFGLLAESPADFADSRHFSNIRDWNDHEPYLMTNKGLRISLQLQINQKYNLALAALKCITKPHGHERVCIWLRRINGDQWVRIRLNSLDFKSIDSRHLPPVSHFNSYTISIRNDPIRIGDNDISIGGTTFQVSPVPGILFVPDQVERYPEARWTYQRPGPTVQYQLAASRALHGQAGILACKLPDNFKVFVMVGTTVFGEAWCLLKVDTDDAAMEDLFLSNTTENDGWSKSIEWRGSTVTALIPSSTERHDYQTRPRVVNSEILENLARTTDPSIHKIVLKFTPNLPKKESATARMANGLLNILPSRSYGKS